MANKNQTLVLRGTAMYAKVLGDPVLNYDKDGKEWKFDFIPKDPKAVTKELAEAGVSDRLRSRVVKSTGEDLYEGAKFMSFRQREYTKDGKPNEPIGVFDILGSPWDQNKLIGNGSIVDVRFAVVDYGPGKKAGVYPRSIRVLDHVPYAVTQFVEINDDDEYYTAAMKAAEDKVAQEDKNFKKDFMSIEDELDDEIAL